MAFARELALKRVLIAGDLSPRSDLALKRAVQVAREQSAALTFLHVQDADPWDGKIPREVTLAAQNALREKMEMIANREAATLRVETGKPFVEIIRNAREEESDLIVLGAHGEDFLEDLLLGTTVERVVRKGDRPVLVVKQEPRRSYQRLLVATDFSENSEIAFELGLRLAPEARVNVLHVHQSIRPQLRRAGISASEISRQVNPFLTEAKENMKALMARIGERSRKITEKFSDGRVHQEISSAARRFRADLVAVGTTGRTGLPYILLGSVAEHVLREAPCDVLVARTGPPRFELP